MINADYDDADYNDYNNDNYDGVLYDIYKASIDLPSKPSINLYNDFLFLNLKPHHQYLFIHPCVISQKQSHLKATTQHMHIIQKASGQHCSQLALVPLASVY